jgi:hypothetical protein
MLSIASTASVSLVTGYVTQSDPVSARATLQLTLNGAGTEVAANMRAALYRLNRAGVDGALVATCNTFAGASAAMLGSMSLNTTELVTAFTNLKAPRQYEQLRFDLLVYDASPGVLVYTFWGSLNVAYEIGLAATGSVNPITGTTTSWGNLKVSGGVVYLLSAADGLYYPVTGAGSGTTIHPVYGETGVAL